MAVKLLLTGVPAAFACRPPFPLQSQCKTFGSFQRTVSRCDSNGLPECKLPDSGFFSTPQRSINTRSVRLVSPQSFCAKCPEGWQPWQPPKPHSWHSWQPQKKQQARFSKVTLLGSGNFGNVYKVVDKNGRFFAQKRIRMDDPAIKSEVKVMEALRKTGPHKNLINLECINTTGRDNHMVMGLGGKSLQSMMKSGQIIRGARLQNFIHQIANGAATMAANGFQHNDIKPDNILIDEFDQVRLCDFGISTQIAVPPQKFPRQYMPPEMMSGNTSDLSKIDSWSIGCVLAEMVVGRPLFPMNLWQQNKQDRHLIVKNHIHYARAVIYSNEGPEAADLFSKMMEITPWGRISPDNILNSKYLQLNQNRNLF